VDFSYSPEANQFRKGVAHMPKERLTAVNGSSQQPWRWLVITDDGLRRRIAGLYRNTCLGKVGGQLGSYPRAPRVA
jgi:hypothetical protein